MQNSSSSTFQLRVPKCECYKGNIINLTRR